MRNKKTVKNIVKDALILILILICVGEGMLLKTFAFNAGNGLASNFKMMQIKRAIDKYYLYDVDEEQMQEYIYKGMVAGLKENYSCYYTKEEYTALKEETQGVFSGIGAVLQQDADGYISVVRTIKGSPAEEAGLKTGDILEKVDDYEVGATDELSSVVTKIKGPEGTSVTLNFIRDKKSKTFTITRKQVESPTVEFEMLKGKVGYVQINEFDEVTVNQFDKALEALREQGMEKMVLDLRNNPGGLLSAAVSISDKILPTGLIVSTKTKDGTKEEFQAISDDELGVPLVVLINEYSASASEIVTGAIQDYGYGTIVGTTSFGKGIVQNIMAMGDGSALKLTISDYYTPKGRSIHKKGIKPDVEVKLDKNLQKKVKIEKDEDNQLQRAIEELNKK